MIDLKRLFGQLDKSLVHDWFKSHGIELDLNWQKLPKSRAGPQIFKAWCDLPFEKQQKLEPDLLEVHNLAHERGVRGIIESAKAVEMDLLPELEKYESPASKILHAMHHHRHFWTNVCRFIEIDILMTKRYWHTYPGLPAKPIDGLKARMENMGVEVAAHFTKLDGTGRVHKITHFVRNKVVDYFFIDLSSHMERKTAVVDAKDIQLQSLWPTFDVVYVFDQTTGELSLLAKGGKPVTESLRAKFCRCMFDMAPPPIDMERPPYQLGSLLSVDNHLPVEPFDCIDEVIVQSLRFWVVGQGKRRILLEGDPQRGSRDVYAMIKEMFREDVVTEKDLRVAGVKFKFIFKPNSPVPKRSVTFEVSYPRTNSFKEEPESIQQIIHRCLQRWGIESASADAAVDQAA